MWPWGHLAVGYLLYSTYTRYRFLEPPSGAAVVWLALGTQFPDLVDKPLAYWTSLLPAGRALAHSFLVVVPLLGILHFATIAGNARRWAVAFAIGYVSHVVMDGVGAVLEGDPGELTFLLWPLLPVPEYSANDFSHHAQRLAGIAEGPDPLWLLAPWDDYFVFQLWLTAAALGLWLLHGAPPLRSLRRWLRERSGSADGGR